MKTVALVGTLDTKGAELAWVRERLESCGLSVLLVDTGVQAHSQGEAAVSAEEVAAAAGESLEDLRRRGDRGAAVAAMARGAEVVARRLYDEGRIHGVLSLGGSAGTTIGTAAMRALPFGVPKLMVSTLASGNTAPYVGTRDLCMLYSVVDIAGLNRVSRRVLANAAGAMAGMLSCEAPQAEEKPVVAATMFGVTTPCVTRAREILEARGYEVLVFHATGTGGRAMEELVRDGYVSAVLDVTTTELADELVGGVLSAGPERLEMAGRLGVRQVVAPGALDMVNFGPWDTVPEAFRGRNLYRHNPTVTLMRTTPEEMARLGETIGQKLSAAKGPTTFVHPLKGVSAIDREGQPFHDAGADSAFAEALKANLTPSVRLVELDYHINDPEFAEALVRELLRACEAA